MQLLTMMLKKERHDIVMRQINLHNRVLTTELAQLLKVSEDTVRRDLNEMANANLLCKVYGGALSCTDQATFDPLAIHATAAKVSIAHKAISLVQDGMVVVTGGGTTLMEFVKQLPKNLQATIFTVSPLIAIETAHHPKIKVILIGGLLAKHSQVTYGSHVISQLGDLNADLCLVGTGAIHSITGLTDADCEVNQLEKAMLCAASKSAMLCISAELDNVLHAKTTALANVDYLITELDPADVKLKAYQCEKLNIL